MEPKKIGLSTPAAILIAGVVIAGAIVYAFGFAPGATERGGSAATAEVKPVPPVSESDHQLGASDPKLTLVEYSDLECPFCAQFHPVVKQVAEELSGEVAWVYRHFPLTQIHPNALPAALASECVAQQKGNADFWNFVDAIFLQQAVLGQQLLETLAEEQGISAAQLKACMEKEETLAVVQQQFNDAVAAGGQGTPFTAVLDADGKQIATFPGSMTYAQLRGQVDALLAKQ